MGPRDRGGSEGLGPGVAAEVAGPVHGPGRLLGGVDEVAAAVRFLALEAPASMTGAVKE